MELSQTKYTETLENNYNVTDLSQLMTFNETLPYKNLLGALNYISCGARPDVSYSVNY